MKKIYTAIAIFALIATTTIISCQKKSETPSATTSNTSTPGLKNKLQRDAAHPHDISVPDANIQIRSYAQSVGYHTYGDSVTSTITMNFDALKEYVLSAANTGDKAHFTFAHDEAYATAHYGVPSNGKHMTLILSITDAAGNLLLNPRGNLLNHMGDLCNSCKCCAGYLNEDGSFKYSVN